MGRNLMCPDCEFGGVFPMSIFKRINALMAVLDHTWRSAFSLDIQMATKDGSVMTNRYEEATVRTERKMPEAPFIYFF